MTADGARPLARVGDVIEHGQDIPANVVRLRDAEGAFWSNRLSDFRLSTLGEETARAHWWPLTVVEVDPEPQPTETGDPIAIGDTVVVTRPGSDGLPWTVTFVEAETGLVCLERDERGGDGELVLVRPAAVYVEHLCKVTRP